MYKRFVKRCLDFILSLIALIILSPVLLIVATLVRCKLGSPIIFKQQRPGLHEKIFCMYKFRTMIDETDEQGNLLPDEVRLTKFGKALRSTSLDELPELFNILKGDMSIIGPRPVVEKELNKFGNGQELLLSVKPGLTGLWACSGRSDTTYEERIKKELYYAENYSMKLDLLCFFKTCLSVVKGTGAR